MTSNQKSKFSVIKNDKLDNSREQVLSNNYYTNPMYEKLLNFRNLQEKQKKRFSPEDLLKYC